MYNDYSKFNNKNDENIKFKDIDIVVSIPICSGLSLINTSKSRGANAEQNDNMYNITTLALEKIKPKCFIFENAPALYTKSGALVVDNLFNIAKKNNYSMSLIKTDTFLHGIPQHRHRTFAIF
jgi:site-specific DNA-cytosine methylase